MLAPDYDAADSIIGTTVWGIKRCGRAAALHPCRLVETATVAAEECGSVRELRRNIRVENRGVVRQRIHPPVAIILEVRIEAAEINARILPDFVVSAPGESPARAVVTIFADVLRILPESRGAIWKRGDIGNRFDVINSSAIPVE